MAHPGFGDGPISYQSVSAARQDAVVLSTPIHFSYLSPITACVRRGETISRDHPFVLTLRYTPMRAATALSLLERRASRTLRGSFDFAMQVTNELFAVF